MKFACTRISRHHVMRSAAGSRRMNVWDCAAELFPILWGRFCLKRQISHQISKICARLIHKLGLKRTNGRRCKHHIQDDSWGQGGAASSWLAGFSGQSASAFEWGQIHEPRRDREGQIWVRLLVQALLGEMRSYQVRDRYPCVVSIVRWIVDKCAYITLQHSHNSVLCLACCWATGKHSAAPSSLHQLHMYPPIYCIHTLNTPI